MVFRLGLDLDLDGRLGYRRERFECLESRWWRELGLVVQEYP